MKYDLIDKNLFIENRKRFVKNLLPESVAIFNSNDEMPRNGDGNFPFRQNSDLLGKNISTRFADMGLLGISNLIIIASVLMLCLNRVNNSTGNKQT